MPEISEYTPKLFVVDDEPAMCRLVVTFAKRAGFEAEMAQSHTELYALLQANTPEVLVVDLRLAGTDGIQILAELGRRKCTSKIIIYSGSDQRILDTARQLAEQHGLTIASVLQKPFQPATFLNVLQKIYDEGAPFSAKSLRSCLEKRQLRLHYQPKVSLFTGNVVGCEALLRCDDPAGRPISPEHVIQIAEQSGLIGALTEWVFREAIDQQRRWREAGHDLGVAVNLSAIVCADPRLPSLFESICDQAGSRTDTVTLELTETAVMDKALVSQETLARLRLKGFRLSIDDFGTGYSSLLRLKQLPCNEIKVDKSFVMQQHNSRDDAAITKAIILLAQSLDLHCVIEGAENQHAIDYAKGLGCPEVQGNYISRSISGTEVSNFIKTWEWRRSNIIPPNSVTPAPLIGEARLQEL